jgi:hypothetical protein
MVVSTIQQVEDSVRAEAAEAQEPLVETERSATWVELAVMVHRLIHHGV